MELLTKYRCLYNSYNYINNQTDHNNKTIDSDTFMVCLNEKISNIKLNNIKLLEIDLSNYFPKIYSKKYNSDANNDYSMGITSSRAITSVMSYYLKLYYNLDKLLSPYFLAYMQYLQTKNSNNIDLLTGINIASTIGICSDTFINDKFLEKYKLLFNNNINDICNLTSDNFISYEFKKIMYLDASMYKIEYFTNIDFKIENIIKLLSNKTPILSSLKIIPIFNNDNFYNHLDEHEYWKNVFQYYKNIDDDDNSDSIYSVSFVIVGFNNNNNKIKIRGCWGDNHLDENNYYFIDYDIIRTYNDIFFDSYIIGIENLSTDNNTIELFNNPHIDLIEADNFQIIKLNNDSIDNNKTNNSLKKISSMGNISDTFINIESLNNLDFICDTIKNINIDL